MHCQVLAVEPLRRLRISWRGGTLDTTVTWTLAAEGHGTRLLIEHAGFDPHDPTQQRIASTLGQGWRSHLVRSLRTVLDGAVSHPIE